MSRLPRISLSRLAACLVLAAPMLVAADPVRVLFVGNSFTFGRVDPVMSYNTYHATTNPGGVRDLTSPDRGGSFTNTSGTNPYEPHNWGGVAGIFQKFTEQAGLDYEVSISARNAASLRGHFLNTNPAGWDLQGNLANAPWNKVVLQGLSDEPLPTGRGANANNASFSFYANQMENYVHRGISAGQDVAGSSISVTETQLWGSEAACRAGTGNSANTCNNTQRIIKGNANESAAAEMYLYQTWARPDMIYAHQRTTTDPNTGAILPSTGAATTYYDDNRTLEAMTADLKAGYKTAFDRADDDGTAGFKAIAPVGESFLRAVQSGAATRNPYATDALTDGLIDLWWDDSLHASKFGSYLSALTLFGTLTGIDPLSLGADEQAARDLGIGSAAALALQRVASSQLRESGLVPEPASGALVLVAGLAAIATRRRSQ
jgi:hypothetical protein